MSGQTIAGVRLVDPALYELVKDAEAQGFRVEKSENGHGPGKKGAGLVLYPPSPNFAPIRFGCTEINPRHVGNIRTTLKRAGFVDFKALKDEPAEPVSMLNKAADQMADMSPIEQEAVMDILISAYMRAGKKDDLRELYGRGAFIMKTATVELGVLPAEQSLLASIVRGFLEGVADAEYREAASRVEQAVFAQDEIAQAMTLAEEAEKEKAAAQRAAASAEKKAGKAADDCATALRRAEQAEAERDELKRVLEPMRAFLAKP